MPFLCAAAQNEWLLGPRVWGPGRHLGSISLSLTGKLAAKKERSTVRVAIGKPGLMILDDHRACTAVQAAPCKNTSDRSCAPAVACLIEIHCMSWSQHEQFQYIESLIVSRKRTGHGQSGRPPPAGLAPSCKGGRCVSLMALWEITCVDLSALQGEQGRSADHLPL